MTDQHDQNNLDRYHRQMLLPGVGEPGQRRLLASRAVIVGCGALGCAASDLLARAGVGELTIVDRDVVEPTNLQRQTLFDERDAAEGLPKAEAARRRLAAVNSGIRVRAVVADFAPANAERIMLGDRGVAPSVVLDGTDNFEARYLINDLSVKHGIPYVYGGAVGTRGMQASFLPGRGPCLRCLFPEPPPPGASPTCDTAGVLGPVIAIIGGTQAADAIAILLGKLDLPGDTMLEFDIWAGQRRRLDISKARDPGCPCCAQRRFEWLEGKRSGGAATLCGRSAVQVLPSVSAQLDLTALAQRLHPHGAFTANPFLVRGRLARERGELGPCDLTVFADGRAIVGGTLRLETARAIYARYIGS